MSPPDRLRRVTFPSELCLKEKAMIRHCSLRFSLWSAALLLLSPAPTLADAPAPTPFLKSIADHDLIVVGRVVQHQKKRVTFVVSETIKGDDPPRQLSLPDTWRRGREYSSGPIRLQKDKSYLLFLHRGKDGYELSRDFASQAVTLLKKKDAAIVAATKTFASLAKTRSKTRRQELLDAAWKKQSNDGRLLLVKAFYHHKDNASVPLLLRALRDKDYNVQEHAHIVIGRHGFKQATPLLIELLQTKKSALAARTLGELKAQEAFDALMKAAQDDKFQTNRFWVVEALGKLEDRRAVPLLLARLKEGVPRTGRPRLWGLEQEFAIEPLGRMKVADAVDPLVEILRADGNRSYLLRTKLVEALGRIGAPAKKALPLLEQFAPDPPAVKAIKQIRQDVAGPPKRPMPKS